MCSCVGKPQRPVFNVVENAFKLLPYKLVTIPQIKGLRTWKETLWQVTWQPFAAHFWLFVASLRFVLCLLSSLCWPCIPLFQRSYLLLAVMSAETSNFPVCQLMVLLLFCASWICRQLTLCYRAVQHVVLKIQAPVYQCCFFVTDKWRCGWANWSCGWAAALLIVTSQSMCHLSSLV